MQRLQWNKDHGANLSPQEKELQELKDENRRLKGLLELREDRAALEKFQIQTRNLIFGPVERHCDWRAVSRARVHPLSKSEDRRQSRNSDPKSRNTKAQEPRDHFILRRG